MSKILIAVYELGLFSTGRNFPRGIIFALSFDVHSPPIGLQNYFALGGISHLERHFVLFKDQFAESGRQKTKENIIPHGKFRLVGNDPQAAKNVVSARKIPPGRKWPLRTRGYAFLSTVGDLCGGMLYDVIGWLQKIQNLSSHFEQVERNRQ